MDRVRSQRFRCGHRYVLALEASYYSLLLRKVGIFIFPISNFQFSDLTSQHPHAASLTPPSPPAATPWAIPASPSRALITQPPASAPSASHPPPPPRPPPPSQPAKHLTPPPTLTAFKSTTPTKSPGPAATSRRSRPRRRTSTTGAAPRWTSGFQGNQSGR